MDTTLKRPAGNSCQVPFSLPRLCTLCLVRFTNPSDNWVAQHALRELCVRLGWSRQSDSTGGCTKVDEYESLCESREMTRGKRVLHDASTDVVLEATTIPSQRQWGDDDNSGSGGSDKSMTTTMMTVAATRRRKNDDHGATMTMAMGWHQWPHRPLRTPIHTHVTMDIMSATHAADSIANGLWVIHAAATQQWQSRDGVVTGQPRWQMAMGQPLATATASGDGNEHLPDPPAPVPVPVVTGMGSPEVTRGLPCGNPYPNQIFIHSFLNLFNVEQWDPPLQILVMDCHGGGRVLAGRGMGDVLANVATCVSHFTV
ncbi:hypothetical protein EDB84DRAFT_1437309 [Lactarius hengduanensis]|nr:hypothetical protein EDB84DRAFT_1437309 [Lactarius hengduanensis]